MELQARRQKNEIIILEESVEGLYMIVALKDEYRC